MASKAQLEKQHQELTELVNPLIEFLRKNNYSYFIIAGKEGTCTQHLMGIADDLEFMISSMIEKNPSFKDVLIEAINPEELRVRWSPKDTEETYDGTVIEETKYSYLVIPDDNLTGTARWNKKYCEILK